jgi:tetratricopeptide (TPR) repeat protein
MAKSMLIRSVLLLLLIFPLCLSAQNKQKIDSLETVLKNGPADTTTANVYASLSGEYRHSDLVKSQQYALQAIALSRKSSHARGLAAGYQAYGNAMMNEGRYNEALSYYDSSAVTWKRVGSPAREAKVHTSMSSAYNNIGNPEAALDHAYRALRIQESLKDTAAAAACLLAIGNTSFMQGDTLKALGYYRQALAMGQSGRSNPSFIGSVLSNIGVIHMQLENYDSALVYFHRSLSVFAENEITMRHGATFTNIGIAWSMRGRNDSALHYHRMSLAINEKVNNLMGVASSLVYIAGVHSDMDQHDSALVYFGKALPVAKQIGAKSKEMTIYRGMHNAYKAKNQTAEARKYQQLYEQLERELQSQ